MTPLEIRSGLRKLEFETPGGRNDDENETVLVEFVHATRIDPHQTVRISLGVRDGVERQLIGRPTLISEQSNRGGGEYYYRLYGVIARETPHR
jgi:hypothetical protein